MLKHSVVDSLHWVREQIETSLGSVQSWLEQYLEAPDEGQLLSDSLDELHQISGTLAMLQLDGPVLLTQEMEQTLQAAIDGTLGDSQSLYEPMLAGLVGLPDYLGWLQEGGEDLPEALLEPINDLREVRGARPISGADIFARAASDEINTDFRPKLVSDGSEPREVARAARTPFQSALLHWYKSGENDGDKYLAQISEIIDSLRDAATAVDNYHIWWAATGFMEALREGGLPVDVHTKKMLGRIERQIKELAQKGEALYADELPREVLAKMLYFVGRSTSSGKHVAELRKAFELDALLPDEGALQSLRDRLSGPNAQVMGTVAGAIIDDLVSVKEALDVFRRSEQGDTEELRPLIETLGGIANTLAILSLPGLENLIRRELEVLENICDGKTRAGEDALMEIASSLLTVETRLEGDTPRDISEDEDEEDEADARDRRMTSPLAVAVFRESLINLARIKERLQEFSGNPQRDLLEDVSAMLGEIRAGLSMLEQERPVGVLADLGGYIDEQLIAAGRAPDEKTMELLADTMVSVEYYLEALQEGRRSPESILDTTEGNLDLLRSRGDEGLTGTLVGGEQAEADTEEVTDAAAEEAAADSEDEAGEAATEVEQAPPKAASARSAPVVAMTEGLDDEILDIFIEEAGEVMEELNKWLPVWRESREDKDALGTVRRGYHTLKGSGRMVGAELIGEFAWSVENMLNRVLENTIPADDRVLTVTEQATAALPALIEQLKGNAEAEIPDLETIMENARRVLEGEGALLEPGAAQAEATPEAAESAAGEDETAAPEQPEEKAAATDAAEDDETPPAADEFAIDEADKEVAPAAATTDDSGEGEGRMEPLLYDIFSRECATHLSAIAEHMQPAVEGGGPPVAGDELVRALHTLHGSANMAEASGIAALAKRLEKLARTMQRHRIVLDTKNAALFEEAGESIYGMIDAYGDKSLDMPEHEALCERIEAFEEELIAAHEAHETDEDAEAASGEQAAAEQEQAAPTGDESEAGDEVPAIQEETSEAAAGARDDKPPVEPDEAELDTVDSMDPDLTEIFVEEATEILSSVDDTLAQWSDQPGKSDLNDALLRDLHTLKGSARMAGARNMGDLTHELESLVQAVVDGRAEADDTNARLMVRVADQLNGMLERARDGVPVAPEHELAEEMMLARGEAPAISSRPAPAEQAPAEPAEPEAEEKPAPAEPEPEPEPEAKPKQKAAKKPAAKTAGDKPAKKGKAADKKAEETPAPAKDTAPAEAKADAEPAPAQKDNRGAAARGGSQEMMRVSADLLDTLLNQAGEVNIYHGRLEQQITALGFNINELAQTITRLRTQLRDLELETEAQILYRHEKEGGSPEDDFDPLEMDRYTHVQQLSRALVESVADLDSVRELIEDLRRESETLLLQQSRVTTDLQDSLMRTRMVPFSSQTPRLRRIVRQTSAELGKPAKLMVEGDQAELDRSVMERMLAPLEHMLRNAISHGLEESDERERAGKPAEGEILMSLRREGSEVVVQVRDDGKGLDLEAIRRKAIERGLTSEGARLNDADIMQFILEPGFSTAKEVTQVAGRGVGMDVVDAEIKQLGGSLEIDSTVGKGTIFTVRLPFTLAISQTLLVKSAGEIYAIPMVGIEGVVRVPTEQAREYLTGELSHHEYAGERYEVRGLSSLLGREHMPEPEKGQNRIPLLLVRAGDYLAALAVDTIIGSRETVVKSVGPQISGIRGIAGATILGDGSVVVILDVGALVRTGFVARISREAEEAAGQAPAEQEAETAAPVQEEPPEEARETVVMVVDDSITVRRVTTRLLERQGMQVLTAKDGMDALAQLQDARPDIMLLDIEMPRMDGFEVATQMRADEHLRTVPIIMITSRVGDKHRQRAFDIGVDEYLGKPYQETELLETIHEVLARNAGAGSS